MSRVLGIDVSTKAVDLVFLDENTDAADWAHFELAGATAFDRLRRVREVTRSWAGQLEDIGVYLAAIERPYGVGKSIHDLNAVFGAVVACLPAGLPLWEVTPAQWRGGLGLKGNASKDECARAVIGLAWEADEWARMAVRWSQDALDAYAVARYARDVNARALEAAA